MGENRSQAYPARRAPVFFSALRPGTGAAAERSGIIALELIPK